MKLKMLFISLSTVTLLLILKFKLKSLWEQPQEKSPNTQKAVNGFIMQIGGMNSIWYDPSPKGISKQIANSDELLKLVKKHTKKVVIIIKKVVIRN